MLKKTRDQIGTAGLVVAIIALVAALTGGALAATGGGPLASSSKAKSKLTKQQIKEVEKLAKKYAGKDGGPGPPGPKGDTGATGVGKEGSPGKEGKEGGEGASVLATQFAIGDAAGCNKLGGAKYEVDGSGVSTEVCTGKEGSPWTAGGSLPPGKEEMGTWSFDRSVEKVTTEVGGVVQEVTVGDSEKIYAPISFPIPLAGGLAAAKVHYSSEATFSTFCAGTMTEPQVLNSGELCVYERPETVETIQGTTFDGIYKPGSVQKGSTAGASKGANKFGAVLRFNKPTEDAHGVGSFAVKG